MSSLDDSLLTFDQLEVGDRFRPLPRSGARVLAVTTVFYTKIPPDEPDPACRGVTWLPTNAIEHGIDRERRVRVPPSTHVVRLQPAPAGTHRMTIAFDEIGLDMLTQRAAEVGCTVEQLMQSMVTEIMGYAGLHGSVLESKLTIEGASDGRNQADSPTGDHVSGIRDL